MCLKQNKSGKCFAESESLLKEATAEKQNN